MKKFIYIFIIALLVYSCNENLNDASLGKLPEGTVNFTIENLTLEGGGVDDFRFVLKNTTQVSGEASFAWKIEGRPEVIIDQTEYTIRIKEKGTYDVTLTVVDGDKTGVLTQQIVQDKEYDGMSDASIEMFNLLTNNGAGQAWVLDHTVAGFVGSGPSGTSSYDRWWDANIGDKDGAEIMDDEFIFNGDGTFEINTNGKTQTQAVDVLRGRSYYTILADGQYDLDVDVDDAARNSGNYTFKLEENDDEEPVAIKLSSEHVCIGYDDENTDRRYEFIDDEDGDPKTIYLRIVSSVENRYCKIIPKGYEPVREAPKPRDLISEGDLLSLLHGNDATNGRTWKLDKDAIGHLGVHGWGSYDQYLDATKWWWHAQADQQAGLNLYDDEFTFFPDGSFVINTNGATYTRAAQEGLDAGYYLSASGDAEEVMVLVDDAARAGHTYSIVQEEDADGNKYIFIQLSSTDVCIGFHDDHLARKYEVFGFENGEDKKLFLGSKHVDNPMYRFNKIISKPAK